MSGTNELDVTLLVMHRNESYPGQFAPEVLAVVDELTLDVNPEWWTEEIAKQKASIGDDASAWAEVTVRLPVETLMSALYPTIAPLNANIVATGQA